MAVGENHATMSMDNDPPTSLPVALSTTAIICEVKTKESSGSVFLPIDEFLQDLDVHLGRANGNVYTRKPGIEGVHDGQKMIRLKKKRFIVIDYGIVPTQADIQAAAIHPHVTTPDGAGKTPCITHSCAKVGVPVVLYDSEPSEAASLYVRSGLCFTCQRSLNEKRRTQRKRKNEDINPNDREHDPNHLGGDGDDGGGDVGERPCRAKFNGTIIDLSPDALIINGPMAAGIKKHCHGYTMDEIATDVMTMMREAVVDTERLFQATTTHHQHQQQQGEEEPHASETDTAIAYAAAAAAAAAAAVAEMIPNQLNPSDMAATISFTGADNVTSSSKGLLAHAQEDQQMVDPGSSSNTTTNNNNDQRHRTTTNITTEGLYERAFTSATEALYLLTQWKASWDAAAATAVTMSTNYHDLISDPTTGNDPNSHDNDGDCNIISIAFTAGSTESSSANDKDINRNQEEMILPPESTTGASNLVEAASAAAGAVVTNGNDVFQV